MFFLYIRKQNKTKKNKNCLYFTSQITIRNYILELNKQIQKDYTQLAEVLDFRCAIDL